MPTYFQSKKEDDKPSEESKEQKAPSKAKPRIYLLDELRGLAVLCMIFYHAFYSMGIFFNFSLGIKLVNFFMPVEPLFAALFIFISGICCNLSHSNIDRGAKLFFISYAVTLVSYFAVGETGTIRFGILHMLSICMMFYGIFGRYMKIIPLWAGVALNIILFFLTYNVPAKTAGIPLIYNASLPAKWYTTDFLYPLGFPDSGFFSADYFPLLPWIFMFLAGCFFGRLAVKNKFPKFAFKKHIPFLDILGRNALLIYLAHQPIIFGIFYGIILIIGKK